MRTRENVQKCAQKRAVMYFGKFEVFRGKKEFCNTITRRSGKPWFSGKNWICWHYNARGGNHQKCTEMHIKKESWNAEKRRTKKRYADISDTLKRGLYPNISNTLKGGGGQQDCILSDMTDLKKPKNVYYCWLFRRYIKARCRRIKEKKPHKTSLFRGHGNLTLLNIYGDSLPKPAFLGGQNLSKLDIFRVWDLWKPVISWYIELEKTYTLP